MQVHFLKKVIVLAIVIAAAKAVEDIHESENPTGMFYHSAYCHS